MFREIALIIIFMCWPWQMVWAGEINFQDASVMDAVSVLARQAGLDVVMSGDAGSAKRTSVHLLDATPEEALEYILRTNGYTYERKGRVILVSTLPQDMSQTAYRGVSRTLKLKYLSADKVSSLLVKLIPTVVALPGCRANSLVLRGRESELDEAEKLIAELDRPLPQILIESQVIEISQSDSIRIGLDHNSGIFNFINGKKSEDIHSTLTALLGSGQANLVANPRIATLDNCEAVINIGNRIPYAVPVSSTSSSTQWTVDYIDAGVKLKITPQLGQENYITTFLQPEVSSISEWRTTAAGEFPVIATRNAAATVRVKNGETIIVGGLMSETDRVNVTRTPILGQIPVLNFFFQNRTVEKAKTEIVFLITPYVI